MHIDEREFRSVPLVKSMMYLIIALVLLGCFKLSMVKETERRAKALSKQTDMRSDYVHTDSLADPKHAIFAEKLSTQNDVKVVHFKDAGHLVNVSHDDKVNRLILHVLNRNENKFFLSPVERGKRN